jgi:hypothetical protein
MDASELRIKELESQLIDIRAELSKYLRMSDGETIIGGIRNLVQISMMNEANAKKAMSLWRELNEGTSKDRGSG